MKKGFAPIVVIFVLAAGFISILYFGKVLLENWQSIQCPGCIPQTESRSTPTSTGSAYSNWKTYNGSGISFKYPPHLSVEFGVDNRTALKAEKEFMVALPGSDQIYLHGFMYLGDLQPEEWWLAVGQQNFEQLAQEVGRATSQQIKLTYKTKRIQFAGKEAFSVEVSSNHDTPQTPEERNLIIFQNNEQNYDIVLSYHEISKDSLSITNEILSTFQLSDSLPNSQQFTHNLNVDLTKVTDQKALLIQSPLTITGKVPSGYAFENSFPVEITNNEHKIITTSPAHGTRGDWTSGQPLEFAVTLKFETNAKEGYLVFKNDNPSGLPENEKKISIPVKFCTPRPACLNSNPRCMIAETSDMCPN